MSSYPMAVMRFAAAVRTFGDFLSTSKAFMLRAVCCICSWVGEYRYASSDLRSSKPGIRCLDVEVARHQAPWYY